MNKSGLHPAETQSVILATSGFATCLEVSKFGDDRISSGDVKYLLMVTVPVSEGETRCVPN